MEVVIAQILVTTTSVTAGALLALLIDRGKSRRTEKAAEINALRLLSLEVASRRALAPEQLAGPVSLDRADPDSDLNRVRRSVVLLRKDVRTARQSLRPRSAAWGTLNAMVAACNVFLEAVDEHPSALVTELEALRMQLDTLQRELCLSHPRDLVYLPAGSAAYAARRSSRPVSASSRD
ncbi:hypothetical protein [Herbiconiux sp.]|uniref:hypothetical protein n=1 Tax=Herbiconiux sp. TaxID=1871186 RepID=UPI0025B99064|nr:hypothetical protein [Herbiconiux sp.]